MPKPRQVSTRLGLYSLACDMLSFLAVGQKMAYSLTLAAIFIKIIYGDAGYSFI